MILTAESRIIGHQLPENIMCDGIQYTYKGHEIKTYFENPDAMLPVRTKHGEIKLLPWGRRQQQVGDLPLGGWARLEAIREGKWDAYFPKPVSLAVNQFMVKDIIAQPHWYTMTRGQWLQGVLAHCGNEWRIYIVTITPEDMQAIHERWPRVVLALK